MCKKGRFAQMECFAISVTSPIQRPLRKPLAQTTMVKQNAPANRSSQATRYNASHVASTLICLMKHGLDSDRPRRSSVIAGSATPIFLPHTNRLFNLAWR
mmetsp:Transcript_41865/g.66508  ORF Transcript_41865/g.66508 Transcript_41865/m.66508 type:complete len:100 (-) Transcript_41865:58-357(-)